MNLICRDKVFCRVTIFSSQSLLSQMLSFCANRALHTTSSTVDIIRIRLKFGFYHMRLGVCTCLEKEKDLGGDREFSLLSQINEAAKKYKILMSNKELLNCFLIYSFSENFCQFLVAG